MKDYLFTQNCILRNLSYYSFLFCVAHVFMPPYLMYVLIMLYLYKINPLNKTMVVFFINKTTGKKKRQEDDLRDDICQVICWAFVCLVRLTLFAVEILDGL